LPEVLADLVIVRTALMNEQFGGKVDDLVATLVEYTQALASDLADQDSDIPDETLERHLVTAHLLLARLRGLEKIPPRWADLVWSTRPVQSKGPIFHDLITLRVDDDRVRTMIPTADERYLSVFYARNRVEIEVGVEAKCGSVRVGLCRADCAIGSSNTMDFSFETADDFVIGTVMVAVPVPRAPDEVDGLPVPCFVSFVEVTSTSPDHADHESWAT
jgi:hypothetical protein